MNMCDPIPDAANRAVVADVHSHLSVIPCLLCTCGSQPGKYVDIQ
ncbi:hypothetical protein ACJ72_03438 [Emergomyces africanus]|uniref:Uncharacterized protein n=1 Tax=Emergomyces africanus TaxID=1955775 RepID=A0A1B7P018_9EURO|nr:hypothetical protein ACJ72_03438 [Emergomyces africanus]